MKEVVFKVLKKALGDLKVKLPDSQLVNMIEMPPSQDMGDYAFPCFSLSPIMELDPHEIALQIREEIGTPDETDFEDIQVTGPYLNFFLNRKSMARQTVWDIITQKKNYGKGKLGSKKKTMVEFPSPNTNKPLHLGHLRNMSIGESVSRILEFNGEKVVRSNLYNDRGIHICQSMLAYEKWGHEKTPEDKKEKPDHFVGDFYVLFHKKKTKKLEEEAQELLRKWEKGDKKTLLLWKVMNDWAIDGFEKTFKKFGISHDVNFLESKVYKIGKKMVMDGLKLGFFEKGKEGEVKVNLSSEGLGEKILLRKDGTAIYIVQDMGLSKIKFDKYKLDRSLYVVGNEQDYHFKVLFTILKKVGLKKEVKHISYGLVNLPHGRMKSREGTVVDADNIIEEVRKIAEKELKKKEKISKKEMEKRSMAIALSAIKYFLLKVDIKKNMLFNPEESISFEGDTGPYLMYSYARASSILKKSEVELKKFEVPELEPQELALVKKLSLFPAAVSSSYKNINPSVISNYSHELCQAFNEFYHSCKVIGSGEKETFRLALVESFRQTIKNSLWLLGINVLEEM